MKKLLVVLTILIVSACAHIKPFGGEYNTSKVDGIENVAIKGYDAVAYFKSLKPMKGSKSYSYNWNGANWFFVSEENKNAFEINPTKYSPQYGGYCAYGISVPEQKIDIDPEAWHIYEGKLYLNYTPNTQDIWLSDKENHIEQADKNWPQIK